MTVIFAFSGIHASYGNKQGEATVTAVGISHSLSQGNVQHSVHSELPSSSNAPFHSVSKITSPDFIFDANSASSDPDNVFSNTKCHPLTAGGSLKVWFVGMVCW